MPNGKDPSEAYTRLCYIMGGAQLQNGLLQSYRSINLTLQGILAGAGVLLATVPDTTLKEPKGWLVPIGFLAVLLLAIACACIMRGIAKARAKCVDWWDEHLKCAENNDLPDDERTWVQFKQHQSQNEKDKKPHYTRRLMTRLNYIVLVFWVLLVLTMLFRVSSSPWKPANATPPSRSSPIGWAMPTFLAATFVC